MKKFILLILILTNSHSFSQWYWQNPVPQGNNIYALKFVTPSLGYAAADAGTILKTIDGGSSWTITANNLGINFSGIDFINAITGVAVGGSGATGMIARTTDGGFTWSVQSTGQYNGMRCISFINSNTGFAGASSGLLYMTTNSGINWSIQNSLYPINNFCFIDGITGYASSPNHIYKTINGGNSWSVIYTNQFYPIMSVSFRDANTGIAVGYWGKIIRTSNGGNTWDSIYGGVITTLNTVCFMSQNIVFAAGNWNIPLSSAIIRSSNAGLNWTQQESGTNDGLYVIAAADSLNSLIAGQYGRILKYNYAGSNWISISSGFSGGMNDIELINSNIIYAVGGGGNGLDIYGRFERTTNGGLNWITINTGSTNRLSALSFIDANTGWVAGDYLPNSLSAIFKTTNGGLNWENQSQNWSPQVFLNDIFFNNANTGTVVGSGQGTGARIYKTTNGGLSWIQQASPITFSLYRIFYTDINTGYIGSDGFILKTTNGGDNWITIAQLTNIFARDLVFLDANTGWVAGDGIFKTTNGGNNFIEMFNPSSTLNSVYFINYNTGYVCGADGSVFSTTNGGNNWFPQVSGTDKWLTGVRFADQNIGWIVGYDGVILHTTNGGFVNINQISNSLPKIFSLSLNYPNPFNPKSKIKFDIAKLGKVKLVIYDILGREVTVLVNERLKPGTYEAEWDGSNYSSGVYFYKLITAGYSETRKMVLIK